MEAVKILKHYDGVKNANTKWCLGIHEAGTRRTFCHGVAYGYGDSDAVFQNKSLNKQKINCPNCIEKINAIKKVKTI